MPREMHIVIFMFGSTLTDRCFDFWFQFDGSNVHFGFSVQQISVLPWAKTTVAQMPRKTHSMFFSFAFSACLDVWFQLDGWSVHFLDFRFEELCFSNQGKIDSESAAQRHTNYASVFGHILRYIFLMFWLQFDKSTAHFGCSARRTSMLPWPWAKTTQVMMPREMQIVIFIFGSTLKDRCFDFVVPVWRIECSFLEFQFNRGRFSNSWLQFDRSSFPDSLSVRRTSMLPGI